MEDGSQRSFFPNGLAIHVYAETLLNREADFDAIVDDYLSHAYGKDWTLAKAYLQKVNDAFDYAYIQGEKPASGEPGSIMISASNAKAFLNPAMAEKFAKVKEIAANGRLLCANHKTNPTRPQAVSWRLMLHHAEYIEGLADVLGEKCIGNDCLAAEKFDAFVEQFGRHEFEIERYFDHMLAFRSYVVKLNAAKKALLQPGF